MPSRSLPGHRVPSPNRFARWPRVPALLLLGVTAVLLVLAALVPIRAGEGDYKPPTLGAKAATRDRDDDLKLYDAVIVRLQHGENYYAAAAAEHRLKAYPLRPGLTVRLPTLAWIEAALGMNAMAGLSLALLGAILLAWWRRLGEEPGGEPVRLMAMAALFLGCSILTMRYFHVLHELWAGGLLALSLGLHRPDRGRWIGAWLAAAAALALREHALPFVLLMAAYALWHRRWKEGAAWIALSGLFLAALAQHLHMVRLQVRPGDPMGASWLTLRGLSGWLSMVVLSSNLRWLPHAVAGPLVVLMTLGWAGWRSSLGSFATLLYLGYGAAFMIAGRGDNWYWGMMIAPTMFVGLAFLPAALSGLAASAIPRGIVARKAQVGQG